MRFYIKEAREKAGISQKELAKKIGVSATTLCGYEKGIHDPKSETLSDIAKFCNVSVDFLLGRMVKSVEWTSDMYQDYFNADTDGRIRMLKSNGNPGDVPIPINDESKENKIEEKIFLLIDNLNEEGKQRVLEYVEDIVVAGRFKKTGKPSMVEKQA